MLKMLRKFEMLKSFKNVKSQKMCQPVILLQCTKAGTFCSLLEFLFPFGTFCSLWELFLPICCTDAVHKGWNFFFPFGTFFFQSSVLLQAYEVQTAGPRLGRRSRPTLSQEQKCFKYLQNVKKINEVLKCLKS